MGIVALVSNVAVLLYLKPWAQVANYCRSVKRGERHLQAYRIAGLLLVLVAVSHATDLPSRFCTQQEMQARTCLEPREYVDAQGTIWQYDGEILWMNHKKYAVLNGPAAKTGNEAQTPVVAGVIRDSDYEEARAIAKANGYNVSKWRTLDQVQKHEAYNSSRGSDVILDGGYQPIDPNKPKPDALEQFVFGNWYWIVAASVAIFLFLQFGGSGESNDTDINDLADPDYRTGFVTDYHGDDAFEVPNGMHSQHQIVPVR